MHQTASTPLRVVRAPASRGARVVRAALCASVTVLVLAVPSGPQLSAQAPDGWELRLDRPNMDPSDVSFTTMGTGLHATTGPAAIFWNPENTVSGPFRVEAELTQMAPTAHGEAYGLFIGGRQLDGEGQSYLYFLVRQDGSYMITHREGSETHSIQGWTRDDAVNAMGDEGRLTNSLAIEVSDEEVSFQVNGSPVERYPAGGIETDGIVGLRVNHQLDLHIANFEVTAR